MKYARTGWLLILALLATPTLGAESGSVLKNDALKAEPFRDAKTVAQLAVGDKVDILKKDGGWLQVNSARGRGWVRMLSIRTGAARKSGADIGGLLGLASGRAGTGKVVAATGVRGLSEEELKAARFDAAQLDLVESYAVSRTQAQQFAAQGKLRARRMDYLPQGGQ